jgi:hypothetical protein
MYAQQRQQPKLNPEQVSMYQYQQQYIQLHKMRRQALRDQDFEKFVASHSHPLPVDMPFINSNGRISAVWSGVVPNFTLTPRELEATRSQHFASQVRSDMPRSEDSALYHVGVPLQLQTRNNRDSMILRIQTAADILA